MTQIIPMKDLGNTNGISELCHKTAEPIFVTKNGYGDLVVMSMETYDAMVNQSAIDRAIGESEAEAANGAELSDARTALRELRRKHPG